MNAHRRHFLRNLCRLIVFLCFAHALPAFAADPVGQAGSVKGTAWAQLSGEQPRKLEKGSPIYQSDIIKTAQGSSVALQFNDQSKFFLGANTEISIDKFNQHGSAEERGFISRVVKGTFRFLTGQIAREKPAAMEVNTSVATIGIRGTHVIGEVNATSATVILAEPEDTSRKTSIEVFNQYGKVLIDEPGYGTEIPDQFSPPSTPRRMQLETINNIMRSMQSLPRINMPQPR